MQVIVIDFTNYKFIILFQLSIFMVFKLMARIMRLNYFTMNIALVTDCENMVPLCPGASFSLELDNYTVISQPFELRAGWYPLVWGQNLKQYDVKFLFCTGVERFMPITIKSILIQCGIQLVPNISGSVKEVLYLWRSGRLIIPESFESKPQTPSEMRQAG